MKWFFYAFTLALTACTYANPVSLARIMTMNPLTANPSDIAVFFDVPDGYGVMPGTAVFSVTGTKNKGGPEEKHDFILVKAPHPKLHGFSLSAADQQRLIALQTKFRAWKADPALDAGGSMSVYGTPCKKSEFVTLGGALSIFIRLKAGQDPLPLVRNAPLASFAEQEDLDKTPLCP